MSNSNTPNEQPERKPACPCRLCAPRAEAPARAPETAAQYLAREQAELDAHHAEVARLRTFLKDCDCPCCSARAKLRAISYDRAEHSPADIHCASTDDPRRAERIADLEAFARAGRYADNADKAVRAAADEAHRIARESCPHPDDLKAIRADLEDE